MQSPWRPALLLCVLLATSAARADEKKRTEPPLDLSHMREELGVNHFTAPSIALLLEELAAINPLQSEPLPKELSGSTPQDRTRLALVAGQVIGEGLLAVHAQKQGRVESSGRLLLKLARGLGLSDRLSKHGKVIIEMAARGKWSDLRGELIRTQAEVEAGMMALKDEEIAHLVSLGGWLRGLEITAQVVADSYTPERARCLRQPDLYDYFLQRLGTLSPRLKSESAIHTITANLTQISQLTSKPAATPLTLDEVRRIRDLTRAANRAIATPAQ